ncbi:MAG: hypothetical protein ABI141_02360 [Gemmatimonadaceae bacterium]
MGLAATSRVLTLAEGHVTREDPDAVRPHSVEPCLRLSLRVGGSRR